METVKVISYEINVDANKSIMTVDFLIDNAPVSPKDCEPFYQELLNFCNTFKTASQHQNE